MIKKIKRKRVVRLVLLLGFFMFFPGKSAIAQDVAIIETELGTKEPLNPKGSTHVEIKEQEIIQIDRSLRKAIEENQGLKEQNKILDQRLRSLRGQRNIEVNRMNSAIVEKEAYKQQNQQVIGANQQLEKDLKNMKAQMGVREREMEKTIKTLEGRLDRELVEGEMFERKTPVTEALQSAINDQKRGLDVLRLVDEINTDDLRIKTGKARVHYNMGNIFVNQGNYKKAIKEYKEALHYTPRDPNVHFNLAFVSGEHMRDFQAARTHYRRYLYLRPEAEDAVLVQEKILEAELHLKVDIPSSTLEKIPKFRSRLDGGR